MNNIFINTTVNRKIRVRIDLFETIDPMFNLDTGRDLTTIDCNITYLKTGRVVPASAQIFPTFADADQYIQTLKRGEGNFVASGLFSVESHGHGIAIVERLRSLAGWVTNTNKGFWKNKVDDNVEQTLGFGEGFLPLLEGTLEGLSTLHGAGLWHGNLLKVIHVGLDNKIKLNNFAQPSMIPHNDFRSMLPRLFFMIIGLC